MSLYSGIDLDGPWRKAQRREPHATSVNRIGVSRKGWTHGGCSFRFPWDASGPAAYADGAPNAYEVADAASPPVSEPFDLETIYRIRRPEMIRYLASFGVDLVEAEDITQEIFLNFFAKPPKPESSDDYLFRWALVCAKNLAINRYRRRRREVSAPTNVWKR